MIVEPKVREFICTTAHPEGCKENVKEQIAYVKGQNITGGPKKVLVIGASTGYGLASRITAAFGCHAATLELCLRNPLTAKEQLHQAGIIQRLLKKKLQKKDYTQNLLTRCFF